MPSDTYPQDPRDVPRVWGGQGVTPGADERRPITGINVAVVMLGESRPELEPEPEQRRMNNEPGS